MENVVSTTLHRKKSVFIAYRSYILTRRLFALLENPIKPSQNNQKVDTSNILKIFPKPNLYLQSIDIDIYPKIISSHHFESIETIETFYVRCTTYIFNILYSEHSQIHCTYVHVQLCVLLTLIFQIILYYLAVLNRLLNCR